MGKGRKQMKGTTTMKKLQQQVKSLQAQILDMQAYLGVLAPMFEREYKKARWNWEGKGKKRK